jgi:hyperosmotically inducible protein
MKTKHAAACLIAAALLGPLAALAEDPDTDRSNPTAFVKDSAITTEIKAKLAAEHITSLARISVDTDRNGVVYLSGSARSQDAIDKAVSIARDTDGVKAVHSTLKVQKDD